MLLARSFVDGIPDDLIDAARVDGATTRKAFRYIMWLLTFPIGAAIIVLTLIGTWSDFLLPLVFLQTPHCRWRRWFIPSWPGGVNNDQTKVVAAAVGTPIPEGIAYLALQLFERGRSADVLK